MANADNAHITASNYSTKVIIQSMNELWTIIHNKMKRVNQSYIRPSREGGRVGCRCSHKLALPRPRASVTRPKSCLDVRDGSEVPDLCPTARPMARMVEMVSSERPPRVSMTKGTNSTPTERQAERLETSLRRTPTWRAWPGVDAASARVDITLRSLRIMCDYALNRTCIIIIIYNYTCILYTYIPIYIEERAPRMH